MDGVVDFIERHKYALTLAILVHLIIFVTLNLYKVSNPVDMPQRKVRVDVELDDYEVELTPEQMEQLMKNQNSGEEPKNMVANANDDREKSYEDYSEYKSQNKNVKDYVKNYEKDMYDKIQKEREAKGEKYVTDVNSNVKIYGGDKNDKNVNNSPNAANQYAGRTTRTYNLDGRGPKDNKQWHIRNPGYRCKGSGTVHVTIKVDRSGNVKDAKLDPSKSSGYTQCMVDNAVKYALLSKFNYKDSAPAMQTGSITYNFIAQ